MSVSPRAPSAISIVQNDVLAEFASAVAGTTDQAVKIYGPQDGDVNPDPPAIQWAPGNETFTAGVHRGGPGSPCDLFIREIPFTFGIFGGLIDQSQYDAERADLIAVAAAQTPPATVPDVPSTYLTDTDLSEALLSNLINAFHRRLTQFGYRAVSGGWSKAPRSGKGLAYVLTIALRLPLVREDNPTVTVTAINPDVEIEHVGS
jgi:hypothetical protein